MLKEKQTMKRFIIPVLAILAIVLASSHAVANIEESALPPKPSRWSTDSLHIIEATAHAANPDNQNAGRVTIQNPADLNGISPVSRNGISTLTEPWFVWHRGGAALAPENSLQAFRNAVSLGARILEFDVQRLADGTLGIMHDFSIDRTTAGSGNVVDQNLLSWRQTVLDAADWSGTTSPPFLPGLWPNVTGLPTFEDVLHEFGNRVILTPEVKDTNNLTASLMLNLMQQYRISPDFILPYSGNINNLAVFTAAGYKTALLEFDFSVVPSTLVAAHVNYLYCPAGSPAGYVPGMNAAGIKVLEFTVETQQAWNVAIADGANAVVSDDPIYASNTYVKRTTDPYVSRSRWEGFIAGAPAANNAAGTFTPPDKWGVSTKSAWAGVMQSWMCPITANSYHIDLLSDLIEVHGGDTTRWFGVDLMANDLNFNNQGGAQSARDGYTCIARKNGQLVIYRVDNGVSTSRGTFFGAARSDGTRAPFRINVTPTTIKISRTDNPDTLTVTDSTYRPVPYVQFGVANAAFDFSGVTYTAEQ